MKTTQTRPYEWGRTLLVLMTCLGILGTGFIVMRTLADMKTLPTKKNVTEKVIEVEVMEAKQDSVIPFITVLGEVKAIRKVPITAELGGKVVFKHPHLDIGGLVQKGDILVKTDTKEIELTLASDKKRLEIIKKNLELAKRAFVRVEQLYKKGRLVTEEAMERAEQAYLSLAERVVQVEHSVTTSQLEIEKSVIYAQFTGRVKSVSVEENQNVPAGQEIMTLVDDSILEIIVSLKGDEAKKILPFEKKSDISYPFWFSKLKKVNVKVYWSQDQDKDKVEEQGFLHRVVAFDDKTRTLKLAVRLEEDRHLKETDFPIVEGMFCDVIIPGKKLNKLIKIPRQAVQYNQTVYLSVGNRLKTVPVNVVWSDDNYAYISNGIEPLSLIILTRLSDPLENTKLNVTEIDSFTQHIAKDK